jgi:hypothetical protein
MTNDSRRIAFLAGALILALTGCGHSAARPRALHGATSSTPAVAVPAARATDPQLGAVVVARAFTAEICPYSYRDRVPYGQRVDAALNRWGAAEFAAAHWWTPARTASAAAGLAANRAEQACGAMTGGLDPEAAAPAGSVAVRLSVTVTAHGQASAATSAQEVFHFVLERRGPRWLLSFGQW